VRVQGEGAVEGGAGLRQKVQRGLEGPAAISLVRWRLDGSGIRCQCSARQMFDEGSALRASSKATRRNEKKLQSARDALRSSRGG
jgi:hypothetical protein